MAIHWFPGHMHATRKAIAKRLPDIDVVIDADRFHGSYATVAQGINDMVNGHITVKRKAMAVVKAFGEGDFDAPMEQLPGKKAFINDTIEQVRTNLKALIVDTGTLANTFASVIIGTTSREKEVRALLDMGVHAALGMAIYTGRLKLEELAALLRP